MSKHNERAKKREDQEDPENFTCGECKKVHPFNEGYKCTEKEEDDEEA